MGAQFFNVIRWTACIAYFRVDGLCIDKFSKQEIAYISTVLFNRCRTNAIYGHTHRLCRESKLYDVSLILAQQDIVRKKFRYQVVVEGFVSDHLNRC